MYSLFIDTHDDIIKIILFKDGKIIENNVKESSMQHSVYTMPMIEETLKNNKITPNELNEIIVVNGPGSFTGVRIGVTIAKTMAYLLNISIKSIDMLEIKSLFVDDDKKIVIESEKNGKYIGIFDKNNILIEDYIYLKNSEYEEYKKNNKISEIDNKDYEKVYEYLRNKENVNPHGVNPIYIKKIGVQM